MLTAPPTLTTPRLLLRQLRDDDLDPLAAMFADPEVMRYIGTGEVADRADTWRAIAGALGHWVLRGYGLYAVERRSDRRLLGRAGLHNPEGWPGLEVGWLLAREAWGHGYATEAATAVRDMAFERMGVGRLISVIQPDNRPSIRVALRIGERPDRSIELRGHAVSLYAIAAGDARPSLLADRRGDGAAEPKIPG